MSKQIANLLNDISDIVHGYPRMVASYTNKTLDLHDKDVERILKAAFESLQDTRTPTVPGENQLSFKL
jgi:hypothetical protein